MRAHRFLTGESQLALAWVGVGPAKAASSGGVARSLPTEHGARDGSGVMLTQSIGIVGPNYAAVSAALAVSRRVKSSSRRAVHGLSTLGC